MQRVILAVALLAFAGLSTAHANPASARDDAITARSQLDAFDPELEADLDHPITFDPYVRPSISFELPELAPDGLQIQVRLNPMFTVYVAADLTSELPRLDAMDGDTYFAPGVRFHVTKQLSFYVEDFQPASGVVGGADEEEVVPDRTWDGHQISVGARYETDRVQLQGAAVIYTLSTSRRESAVGVFGSVTFRF